MRSSTIALHETAMKIFVVAATTFLLITAGSHAQSVSVRNLTPPGAFEVVNESGGEVSLSSRVQVHSHYKGAWQNEEADLHLVHSCDLDPLQIPACVTLHAGEHLRPPPWNGFSCSSQCPSSCRGNIVLPPGTFRFVVAPCSGGDSIVGPAFEMDGQARQLYPN